MVELNRDRNDPTVVFSDEAVRAPTKTSKTSIKRGRWVPAGNNREMGKTFHHSPCRCRGILALTMTNTKIPQPILSRLQIKNSQHTEYSLPTTVFTVFK